MIKIVILLVKLFIQTCSNLQEGDVPQEPCQPKTARQDRLAERRDDFARVRKWDQEGFRRMGTSC